MIVNELITSVASSDKENEGTEGRREISCLGMSSLMITRRSLTTQYLCPSSVEGSDCGDTSRRTTYGAGY